MQPPQGHERVRMTAHDARNYQVTVEQLVPHVTARAVAVGRVWVVFVHEGGDSARTGWVLRTPLEVLSFLVDRAREGIKRP